MLDSQIYRTNEQLAKSLLPNWRIGQVHNLDQFERVGFPVRAYSYPPRIPPTPSWANVELA